MSNKKHARNRAKKLRNKVWDRSCRHDLEACFYNRWLEVLDILPIPQKTLSIAVYYPIYSEPPLFKKLLEWAQKNNHSLFLPRIFNENKVMIFNELKSDSLFLKLDSMGMVISDGKACCAATLDVIIIPCLGVSTNGYRLGYGGGYYDRFFASIGKDDYDRLLKIGVTYDVLMDIEFNADEWDHPLDMVITESLVRSVK